MDVENRKEGEREGEGNGGEGGEGLEPLRNLWREETLKRLTELVNLMFPKLMEFEKTEVRGGRERSEGWSEATAKAMHCKYR